MVALGIAWAGALGALFGVGALIVFDVLRRAIPRVYEYRHRLHEIGTRRDSLRQRVFAPPNPSRGPMGWLGPCLALDVRTLARTHGLDAALLLRALRLHLLLFAAACALVAAPLAALYHTAPANRTGLGLYRLTAARLAESDLLRQWLAPVFLLVLTALAVALVLHEIGVYAHLMGRYRGSRSPSNYALLACGVPRDIRSHPEATEAWSGPTPGVARILVLRRAKAAAMAKTKFWNAVQDREVAEALGGASVGGEANTLREREARAAGEVDFAQQGYDRSEFEGGENAAVVLFHTRAAATETAVAVAGGQFEGWRARRAPEPEDVNWGSLGVEKAGLRGFVAVILTGLVMIVWTVVAGVVEGFVNLTDLAQLRIAGIRPFGFATSLVDVSPIFRGALQGFLPVAVFSLTLLLLPSLSLRIANLYRTASYSRRDSIARNVLFVLLVWAVVVASLGTGVLTAIASKATRDVNKLIDMITVEIPLHSGFVMTFVVLHSLFGSAWTLLQLPRILQRKHRLRKSVTLRQMRASDDLDSQFPYPQTYAYMQLMALLGVLYAPIAPAVVFAIFLYYLFAFPVIKYNLCYSTKSQYEGAGELFPASLHALLLSCMVGHLTLSAFLGLREAIGPAILAGVPALFFIPILILVSRRISSIRTSPTIKTANEDIEESHALDNISGSKPIPPHLLDVYIQPALCPLPEDIDVTDVASKRTKDSMDSYIPFTPQPLPESQDSPERPQPPGTATGFITRALQLDDEQRPARRHSVGSDGKSIDWYDSRASLSAVPFFQNSARPQPNTRSF